MALVAFELGSHLNVGVLLVVDNSVAGRHGRHDVITPRTPRARATPCQNARVVGRPQRQARPVARPTVARPARSNSSPWSAQRGSRAALDLLSQRSWVRAPPPPPHYECCPIGRRRTMAAGGAARRRTSAVVCDGWDTPSPHGRMQQEPRPRSEQYVQGGAEMDSVHACPTMPVQLTSTVVQIFAKRPRGLVKGPLSRAFTRK